MKVRRGLAATIVVVVVAACGSPQPAPEGEPPGDIGRAPDAVGTLSETWNAGTGGPVSITAESATWGLASDHESWDGAELGIKRGPVPGAVNRGATIFFDGDGQQILDPSEDLRDGQSVRVWCDMVAQSLPPICSVSHLQVWE